MRNSLFIFISLLSFSLRALDDNTLPLNKKTPSVIKKEKMSAEDEAADILQQPKPYVASIGTFGSSRVNDLILKETIGQSEFDEWIKKGLNSDSTSLEMEKKFVDKLKSKFGFAFAEFSVMQTYEPGDLAIHITLDVVEKQDVAVRMPFHPEPTKEFKDPDNLINLWAEYESTAMDLIDGGLLQPEMEKCPAFHCPFGHKHEKLKKFEKLFVNGVKKNQNTLMDILTKDKRGEYRAAAAYLLAYVKDAKLVIPLYVDRIKDPEGLVRNNVLRVLGDIAEQHKEYIIPAKPIIEALNFPKTSDRSKAVFAILHLVEGSKDAKTEILKTGLPALLQLLSTKSPDQRELSFNVLRYVSGKDYTITDAQGWTNWYSRLEKERQPTNK